MADGRTRIAPLDGHSTELVATLTDRATLVSQLRDPDVTLARAAATYLFTPRRLAETMREVLA